MPTPRGTFSPFTVLSDYCDLHIDLPLCLPAEEEHSLILISKPRPPDQVHLLTGQHRAVEISAWLAPLEEQAVFCLFNRDESGELRVSILVIRQLANTDPLDGTPMAQSAYLPTRLLPPPSEARDWLRVFAAENELNPFRLLAAIWATERHLCLEQQ
ncbi:MAG: hypothetical protein AAB776_04050 [Patescibacteria group bacterium]